MNPFIFNSKKSTNERTLLIVLGESNAGGIALNTDCSVSELQPKTKLKIWNRTNNTFEPMQIGSNNLLNHWGLESYWYTRHGMENQISYYNDLNYFGSYETYLYKAGCGGTRIRHWVDGDAYNGHYAWSEFQSGLTAILTALSQYSLTINVIISLGINDGIDGTDPATFKTKFQTWVSNIRSLVGNIDIYITQIMSTYSAINDKLIEIDNEDAKLTAVSIIDAGLQDGNHWNYSGFKLIIDRIITAGL